MSCYRQVEVSAEVKGKVMTCFRGHGMKSALDSECDSRAVGGRVVSTLAVLEEGSRLQPGLGLAKLTRPAAGNRCLAGPHTPRAGEGAWRPGARLLEFVGLTQTVVYKGRDGEFVVLGPILIGKSKEFANGFNLRYERHEGVKKDSEHVT